MLVILCFYLDCICSFFVRGIIAFLCTYCISWYVWSICAQSCNSLCLVELYNHFHHKAWSEAWICQSNFRMLIFCIKEMSKLSCVAVFYIWTKVTELILKGLVRTPQLIPAPPNICLPYKLLTIPTKPSILGVIRDSSLRT